MKKYRRGLAVILALIVLLAAAWFLYTRPMTLSQLYPELKLGDCDEITCAYDYAADPERLPMEHDKYSLGADSEKYRQLCTLFQEQKYRRSLKNLLRLGGRRYSVRPGDTLWTVGFLFGKTEAENGHTKYEHYFQLSTMLGELDLSYDGQLTTCFIADRKAWSKTVYQLLSEKAR